MGCGESKHAVATETTLTKSKSRTKNIENNPTSVENTTSAIASDPIKKEAENESHNVKETEQSFEVVKEDSKKTDEKENGSIDDHGKSESVVEAKKEEKLEGKTEELKADDDVSKKEKVEVDQEKVVTQPDQCPNDSLFTKIDQEETSVVEGKYKGGDEAKENEEKKEEVLKVDERKELVPSDETKSPAEENAPAAKNENADAASTNEVKAN